MKNLFKNKKILSIIIIGLIVVIGILVAIFGSDKTTKGQKNEGEELETLVILDDDVNTSDNSILLNGTTVSYKSTNVTVEGTDIIINAAGEYIVKGTLDDGRIIVDADSDADVTIIFAGVNISNDNSSCVYVKNADKVIINLADGTENMLNDGKEYVYDVEAEEEPNAAIFSKDDLVIAGTGKLTVNGNYNNGIASKDDLKITGGDIIVTATNNGLKGKDSLVIANANITVDAVGDALKSDNETEVEKGFIYIESGTFNITSGEDGMHAATDIEITDGTFIIDSEDDGIHANVDVVINGGTFELASGDDGMHADTNITINDGNIEITKSYEGIEATNINICGGTIDVTASDDGLNAAGGNDGSAMGRPGMDGFSASSGSITFTGGTLTMDASGDGVDSNGTVVFNGGKVIVYGPTNNGNGTLDYQTSWTQNGGAFIGIGSSGMAQMPGNSSSQNSVMITFSTTYGNGDVITVKDSNGNVVMEIEGHKSFNNVVFSNSDLKDGQSYTIYVNDEKYDEFTISSVCTTIGSVGGMGGPGGGMGRPEDGGMVGPGGGRPGGWR